MRTLRIRALLLVAIGVAVLGAGAAAPVGAGGADPGTYWELVDGEYQKRYEPLRVDDDATSVPSDWQRRLPVPGAPLPFDLQAMEVGRVTVDPAILDRIPLPGLSTLPADPNVIGPTGVVLDPAQYRDVMQVDLVLGAPLDQLPAGQGIGLAVLRAVDGRTAFAAPGTQFDGATVAERYVSDQGLQRLAVSPASGRFEPTESGTLLFLLGDRARFWIPWADATGTNAIQVHTFQPGTQVADTSSGEPGVGTVLAEIDPEALESATLVPRATDDTTAAAVSDGTSVFVWVLVAGTVLVLLAALAFVAPTLLASPGGPVVVAPDAPKVPTSVITYAETAPTPREERRRRRREQPRTWYSTTTTIEVLEDAETATSMLEYAEEPMLIGDHLAAAGDPSTAVVSPPEVDESPDPVRVPPESVDVALPVTETPEIPTEMPFEEMVPEPPSWLVVGESALDAPRVTPCEPERAAWTAAQRACEQARFEAAAAEADAADARAELDRLRAEYPPLDWQGTGGLDATMDTGEHVTDLDMRLGDFAERRAGRPALPPGAERAERSRQTREDARAEYDDMQRRAQPLRERVAAADAARARAEEACARADEARQAYERCMGLWSQRAPKPPESRPMPTPAPTPVGTGSRPSPPAAKAPQSTTTRGYEPPRVVSGAAPGTIAAPPTPPGGCTEDKVQEVGSRAKFRVGRTLNLQVRGGPFLNDWDSVAPGFERWASALGYSGVQGQTLRSGGEQVMEVAGADVPQLLGGPMWRDFTTAVVEITAWVRFEEVTMVCERRWPCVHGTYGPALTTTRRVRQDRFTTVPRTLGDLDDKVAVDRQALVAFLRDVWKEFAEGEQRLAEWVARCH